MKGLSDRIRAAVAAPTTDGQVFYMALEHGGIAKSVRGIGGPFEPRNEGLPPKDILRNDPGDLELE